MNKNKNKKKAKQYECYKDKDTLLVMINARQVLVQERMAVNMQL